MSVRKLAKIKLLDKKRTYKGRLLGLIDDKEFHALITRKKVQNKIFSGQTIPMLDIVNNFPRSLKGMRVVLAVREIDNKVQPGKHLFITEKLDYICFEDDSEIGILGEENEYYTIQEEV